MALKRFLLNRSRACHIILLLLCVPALLFLAWNIELFCYNPLSEEDLLSLFKKYDSVKKIQSKDVLFQSIHGEAFELHHYRISGGEINPNFPPKGMIWDNYHLSDYSFSAWTKNVFGLEDFWQLPENRITRRFYKLWIDPSYYHCYLYYSEMRSYWFIYSPNTESFYYLIFKV